MLAGLNPVVAVDQETSVETDSLQDPDMEGRGCLAGIIHVKTELRLYDKAGKEYIMLNENVLIEIGAAMALYEDNFILLVEKGVDLPSNLQGLGVS